MTGYGIIVAMTKKKTDETIIKVTDALPETKPIKAAKPIFKTKPDEVIEAVVTPVEVEPGINDDHTEEPQP